MYQHILIPTDGSELAQKAVTHGLSSGERCWCEGYGAHRLGLVQVYDVPSSKVNLGYKGWIGERQSHEPDGGREPVGSLALTGRRESAV